jgi:hypothetical protein
VGVRGRGRCCGGSLEVKEIRLSIVRGVEEGERGEVARKVRKLAPNLT